MSKKIAPGLKVKITDGDNKNRTGEVIKMGAASFPVFAYVELRPTPGNNFSRVHFVDTKNLQVL